MTILADRPGEPPPGRRPTSPRPGPRGLLALLTSTDHKRIGVAYMVTAFVFFLVGGALAMLIRVELADARPAGRRRRHATTSCSRCTAASCCSCSSGRSRSAWPTTSCPLQIGAPDMAFPRLNALSYWLFLVGGLTMLAGFLTADGAADFGWSGYAPLSDEVRSPGLGGDLWLVGLVLTGFSGILTAVNILATVFTMRARGMTMFRMPIFTWNMVVTSIARAHRLPRADRRRRRCCSPTATSAPTSSTSPRAACRILWQHLFWFFGHPEVYIVVLPYFGVITEVIPVFSLAPGVRLQGPRPRHAGHRARCRVACGPTTCSPPGAVLLPFFCRPLVPHRRAHRREVLQLDRHHVGRSASRSTRRCCSPSASC